MNVFDLADVNRPASGEGVHFAEVWAVVAVGARCSICEQALRPHIKISLVLLLAGDEPVAIACDQCAGQLGVAH